MSADSSVRLSVGEDVDATQSAFLVTFANGQLHPSSLSAPKFSLYQKSNDRTKRKKLIVAETKQMAYVGTNFNTDSLTQGANLCKYYVGSVDRDAGTLSLRRAEVFSLTPHIPGKTDLDYSSLTPSKRERAEVADQLVSSFGSERQKRAYAASKRNRVGETALESALASAIEHAQTSTEGIAEDFQLMQSSGVVPVYNAGAQTPQDVYDLNSIVSLDELKVLKRSSQFFTTATAEDISQWREEERYCEYVLQHISSLPLSEPAKGLKASILLYISFLVTLYLTEPRAFEEQGLQVCGVAPPPLVRQQLLARFAERREEEGGHVTFGLSSRIKDKTLSHLLVLALVLDDFSVVSLPLQRDLRITANKLMDHFRALGCGVTRAAVKRKADSSSLTALPFSATLKIPLNFPKPKKGRKSKNQL